jgi:uroporphyrinogen-III synthase
MGEASRCLSSLSCVERTLLSAWHCQNTFLTKTQKSESLTGLRILVGRARHQANALSSGLGKLGADVIEIPFIEIRQPRSYKPFDSALKRLSEYDWLILTSVNGVDAIRERMRRLRISKKSFGHLKIAAIGPATKEAIEEELKLHVDVVPKKYVAESVVASLRKRIKGKRVLLARARVARDVIPRELRKLGATVNVVEAYETVVPRKSRLRLRAILRDSKKRPDVITFTSSSTVRNFLSLVAGRNARATQALQGIRFASIGPITSSTLRELGLPVHIEAEEYTIPGLIKAIVAAWL